MNEQEWLICDDSIPMLDFLRAGLGDPFGAPSGKATQRKLRLFACECVRRTGEFGGPDALRAIRVSEQYADGLVDEATLEAAFVPVRKLPEPIPFDADMALSVFGPTDMEWEARLIDLIVNLGPDLDVFAVARKAAEIVTEREGAENLARRGRGERGQQAHLLRDIFGNPLRPVPLDPSRLNDETRSAAKTIYEKGRFANLRLLARALKKDAGCSSRELRDHCEWPIRHVRGCWAVDLVLGNA
jgi:hypothetical protein